MAFRFRLYCRWQARRSLSGHSTLSPFLVSFLQLLQEGFGSVLTVYPIGLDGTKGAADASVRIRPFCGMFQQMSLTAGRLPMPTPWSTRQRSADQTFCAFVDVCASTHQSVSSTSCHTTRICPAISCALESECSTIDCAEICTGCCLGSIDPEGLSVRVLA